MQVSQLVVSVVFPLLAAAAGWRGAALAIALVPLVLMVMTWRARASAPLLAETSEPVAEPDPGEPDLAEADDANADPAAPVTPAPATSPRYPGMMWALAAFGLLNGIGVQATNVYMPLFSVRELDFPLVLGGVTAAVAGAIGVAARVGWARQMARGASGPRVLLLLALIAVTGAALFFAAGVTGWAWLWWIAAALHGTSALGVCGTHERSRAVDSRDRDGVGKWNGHRRHVHRVRARPCCHGVVGQLTRWLLAGLGRCRTGLPALRAARCCAHSRSEQSSLIRPLMRLFRTAEDTLPQTVTPGLVCCVESA